MSRPFVIDRIPNQFSPSILSFSFSILLQLAYLLPHLNQLCLLLLSMQRFLNEIQTKRTEAGQIGWAGGGNLPTRKPRGQDRADWFSCPQPAKLASPYSPPLTSTAVSKKRINLTPQTNRHHHDASRWYQVFDYLRKLASVAS